jgi:hypothetical protein
MGPVEYLVVEFPGNQFNGEIVPALIDLVESGTIHIIDLLFIMKDEEGNVSSFELSTLPEEEAAPFEDLEGDIYDLLSEEDILAEAELLQPGSSGAILVFENVWAERFATAVRNANGRVVDNARIPMSLVEAVMAAIEE